MPLLGPLVDAIQGAFPSLGSQFLGTVVAILGLLLAAAVTRRSGSYLKTRLDDALVESAQAAVMATTTALVGGFLVVIWRATDEVDTIVSNTVPTQEAVVQLVFSVAILAVAYSVTRVTKNAIKRLSQSRSAFSNHQQEVAHHVVQITVYVLAVSVVLALWSIDLSGLLVGAGVAGVVIGLAARQTLGAVLAGFVVLFSRPFELGDWVKIDENEGVVTDISIVNTQLRTFDDEYVMIPNDIVTSTDLVNRSRKGRLRVNVDVGVDYDTPIDQARAVATGVMEDVDLVMDKPDPHVVLSEFGASSVVLRLRFYIDNPSARKMWEARTRVISDLKEAYEAEDIKIPYPQRELMAREEAGGFRLAGEGSAPAGPPADHGDENEDLPDERVESVDDGSAGASGGDDE